MATQTKQDLEARANYMTRYGLRLVSARGDSARNYKVTRGEENYYASYGIARAQGAKAALKMIDNILAGIEHLELRQAEKQRHAGWTNYETFIISQDILQTKADIERWKRAEIGKETHEVAQEMKEYYERQLEREIAKSTGIAMALGFGALADVNWYEIAQNIIDNH